MRYYHSPGIAFNINIDNNNSSNDCHHAAWRVSHSSSHCCQDAFSTLSARGGLDGVRCFNDQFCVTFFPLMGFDASMKSQWSSKVCRLRCKSISGKTLNPMRDKKQGTCTGGDEGITPATRACPKGRRGWKLRRLELGSKIDHRRQTNAYLVQHVIGM